MQKVDRDIALKEFNSWIAAKKISDSKRDSLKDVEEEILDAICEGYLTLTDNKEFVQILKFPIENIEKLTFKMRINVGVIQAKTRGLKPDDLNGRLLAYISALTDENNGNIRALDSVDYAIASSIAVYFF